MCSLHISLVEAIKEIFFDFVCIKASFSSIHDPRGGGILIKLTTLLKKVLSKEIIYLSLSLFSNA